ncbi:protease inhibitor I42 family protein [Clostridium sp.]
MKKNYEDFKLNAIVLTYKSINSIPLNAPIIIELEQSPSTGYRWYYTVSDISILILEEKKIFDFNKPNIIGGSHHIIWKFKPLKYGECKIHFTYYKSWKRDPLPIDELNYIIKVE